MNKENIISIIENLKNENDYETLEKFANMLQDLDDTVNLCFTYLDILEEVKKYFNIYTFQELLYY